jgi:hypothetical protein
LARKGEHRRQQNQKWSVSRTRENGSEFGRNRKAGKTLNGIANFALLILPTAEW